MSRSYAAVRAMTGTKSLDALEVGEVESLAAIVEQTPRTGTVDAHARAVWKNAVNRGLVPSGILSWLTRQLLWKVIQYLTEEWNQNNGSWQRE